MVCDSYKIDSDVHFDFPKHAYPEEVLPYIEMAEGLPPPVVNTKPISTPITANMANFVPPEDGPPRLLKMF